MKAYVLHGINDLRLDNVDMPELKNNWVIVRVMAAGICGSDIPRIFQNGTYHFPTIPGHEFSGTVVEAKKEDKSWIGKRVGVFPLIPCKKCAECQKENYEMCSSYSYLGSRTDGGFAQYVAVPVWNLIELPESVSFKEGAMLEPASVALHALRQVDIKKMKSIAIWGAGPIGLLMAQWARALGVEKVYLCGNKEGQRELARKVGFTHFCNTKTEDALAWLAKETDERGIDLVIEGVGRGKTLENCINAVAPKGEILLLANPQEDYELEKNVYWKILRKQLTICGTWNSKYGTIMQNDWKDAIEAIAKNQIQLKPLITHELPFDSLKQGLEIMRGKQEFYCKVMIEDKADK